MSYLFNQKDGRKGMNVLMDTAGAFHATRPAPVSMEEKVVRLTNVQVVNMETTPK